MVNTGDSLVALRYRLGTEADCAGAGEWVGGKHSFQSQHTFASGGQPAPTASQQCEEGVHWGDVCHGFYPFRL